MSFKPKSLKFQPLSLAIASFTLISTANAAGLDRSTQPSWGFVQDGTFAYIENITINPTIEGKDNKNAVATKSNYAEGKKVSDMAEDYNFWNFGAKADVNDRVSVGAFFDEPWGANVEFHGNNNFVAHDANTSISSLTNGSMTDISAAKNTLTALQTQLAATTDTATKTALTSQITNLGTAIKLATLNNANAGEGTKVDFSSENFTGLVGVKLGEKKHFQVFGGPAIQKIESDIHLRGLAYKGANGYDAHVSQDTGMGWVAGVAYSKPEIGLKASLTYRSEIDHDTHMGETLPALGSAGTSTNKITITTPQSVNLDFQTGLNKTTLLTSKLRWVPWSDFAIKPKVYGSASGLNLVSYDDDAWSGEVGIAKKVNPKLALSGAVGYDSGAGNPVSSLGPVEGNWNVGLNARYNLTPEWAIGGGVKYLMFGDAKAKLPDGSIVGDFKNNDAWVYGIRLTYQKK